MHILYNQLTTPDGTILVSSSRHDYVSHTDANGKYYFLDGGTSYIRASTHSDQKILTITTDTDHPTLRKYVTWGTYGKSGNEPLRRVTIANLSTNHVKAIIDYLPKGHIFLPILKTELEYRHEHENQPQTSNN